MPELIVSADDPVELISTDCVAVVFRLTLPKAMLLDATFHAGPLLPAVSCKAKVVDTPPANAVMVAVWVVVTAEAVVVKAAVVAPVATVTDAGTFTAELLLVRVTARPPVGAAPVSATEHASVVAPVTDPLVQETAWRADCTTPVPLRPMVAVPPDAALLMRVTVPESVPAALGSNAIAKVALCPGFSVTGNERPEMLKPVPVTVPERIVRGVVPVDLMRTDLLTGVWRLSLPKARLLAAIVHAGAAAFSWSVVVRVTPPSLALIVAACVLVTAEIIAVKLALDDLLGM